MILEIQKPETAALIDWHLQNGDFRDLDDLLTRALAGLRKSPVSHPDVQSMNLVELFAPVRGLFADGELDFSRNPSTSRPLDLS